MRILHNNLSGSKLSILYQLEAICGIRFSLIESDVRNIAKLEEASKKNYTESVIHSMDLKAGDAFDELLRQQYRSIYLSSHRTW